jgi:glucokinase
MTTAGRTCVLAYDIGGTWLRAALFEAEGTALASREIATPRGTDDLIGLVRACAEALPAEAGVDPASVAAAGIGLPIVLDPRGGLPRSTHNVPALDGLPDIPARLAAACRMPAAVDNDANLAALAEATEGAGRGHDPVVCIAIGTGIGMGIVVAGEIIHGAHGGAGEIGFLPVGSDPWSPAARRAGSLELEAAGPAFRARIAEAVAAAAKAGTPHLLAADSDAEELGRAAAAGDEPAIALLRQEARAIALGIAAVAAVLDPAIVVLSGGLGSAPALLGPARHALDELMAGPPTVVTGALGSRAPLLGARIAAARLAGLRGGSAPRGPRP